MRKLLTILAAAALLAGCGNEARAPASETPAAAPAAVPDDVAEAGEASAEETVAVAREAAATPPPPSAGDDFDWPAATHQAVIETSMGAIELELYGGEAPLTVANFLAYAGAGHYDRTIIHRVVHGVVVQGGGYSRYFNERPLNDPVPYEGANGLKNYRGTIAMARTDDRNSAQSQWFINVRDNPSFDHGEFEGLPTYGYAVFGRVTAGLDVIDAIAAVPTGPGGPFEGEVPIDAIEVERVDVTAAGGG